MSLTFSKRVSILDGRKAPEEGTLAGYAAIINALRLPVPMPARIALISDRRRAYSADGWQVYPNNINVADTLYHHLVFALKYEGIHLLVIRKLFTALGPEEATALVTIEPTGIYSRRLWFLFEWLTGHRLPIPDLTIKNYVPLIDDKIQYATARSIPSPRHRIRNNLPGTPAFCPLVYRTKTLDDFMAEQLDQETTQTLYALHPDVLRRTSAFLMLKDSQASFRIEKESPPLTRAARWGRAIGEAGRYELSHDEFVRLQQIIISDNRFIAPGYRTAGGFVGSHDRETGEPIPDHLSARPEDLPDLMDGLLDMYRHLAQSGYPPVPTAAAIAFGFVFIHPFADGNGRLHRYLIHHVLSSMGFAPPGIIFPVSSAILIRHEEYRRLLEVWSHPLLDFIDWEETPDHNVRVLNETADYYRYFDATPFTEFLFACIRDTIRQIIPAEVDYLRRFDAMSAWLKDTLTMPDPSIALLIRFLEQNGGTLSRRAREKEFAALTDKEAREIEQKFKEFFT